MRTVQEVCGETSIEPVQGGVGWVQGVRDLIPSGHTPLYKINFLPTGSPAHFLNPQPLMSPADSIWPEFRKGHEPCITSVCFTNNIPPGDVPLGEQMNRILSTESTNKVAVASLAVFQLSELKWNRQVRSVVAPGLQWPAARRPNFHI